LSIFSSIKESIKEQLKISKFILQSKWEDGAKEGKKLKEKQKKVLEKKK